MSSSNSDESSPNPSPNPNLDHINNETIISESSKSIISPTSLVSFYRFAGHSTAAATVGSIVGYGSGLIEKRGFKGSFGKAGSFAKAAALMCGVHTLVECLFKRLRGKDDAINAAVAGCSAGLALSFPGAPRTVLSSCLALGAFSFIIEGQKKQPPALAHQLSAEQNNQPTPVVSLMAFPLPSESTDAFSSFYDSLRRPGPGPVSH